MHLGDNENLVLMFVIIHVTQFIVKVDWVGVISIVFWHIILKISKCLEDAQTLEKD